MAEAANSDKNGQRVRIAQYKGIHRNSLLTIIIHNSFTAVFSAGLPEC